MNWHELVTDSKMSTELARRWGLALRCASHIHKNTTIVEPDAAKARR